MELLFVILFLVLVFSGPEGVVGLITGLFSFVLNFLWIIAIIVGASAVYWMFSFCIGGC